VQNDPGLPFVAPVVLYPRSNPWKHIALISGPHGQRHLCSDRSRRTCGVRHEGV